MSTGRSRFEDFPQRGGGGGRTEFSPQSIGNKQHTTHNTRRCHSNIRSTHYYFSTVVLHRNEIYRCELLPCYLYALVKQLFILTLVALYLSFYISGDFHSSCLQPHHSSVRVLGSLDAVEIEY